MRTKREKAEDDEEVAIERESQVQEAYDQSCAELEKQVPSSAGDNMENVSDIKRAEWEDILQAKVPTKMRNKLPAEFFTNFLAEIQRAGQEVRQEDEEEQRNAERAKREEEARGRPDERSERSKSRRTRRKKGA